ncbi:MAG TPA: amino acid adenylation domain-containing protein [Pyrinomonadaceae bacterium]|jgi:amino acid adenylation domain-containing protein
MESSKREGFHLSPQQKNGWSFQQTAFSVIRIEGPLQLQALKSAVNTVVERHEILRTTFYLAPGIKTPFQVISPAPQFSWQSVDLTNQEERIAEYIAREQEQPFDYFQGPLLRVTLIKQSDTRHLLLVLLPALCADSATLANFISELSRAYAATLEEDEPLQYADYAEWQLELLDAADEQAAAGKAYWTGVPSSPVLPMQRRIVRPQEFAGDSVAVDLELEKIGAVAEEQETSVATVLFAAWQAFIWRLTGSECVVFNLTSGRKLEDLANAMGLYAKYLPIISRCEDEPFVLHLRNVHQVLAEATEWQEYFDPSTSAVRDSVGFDFEDRQTRYDAAELLFSVIEQHVCLSPFKLKLSCVRTGAILSSELHYDTHVFDKETVKQFAGYVQRFVFNVLQHPERRLSEIDMMDADELLRSLPHGSELSRESIDKTVHELFETQAASTPAALGLVSGDQELTYEELNTRANQLAHLLRRRGVGPDVRVGLCMERSAELIVGLLGILKAGGAYVPLNPDHPHERLEMQLRESQSLLLVTNGGPKLDFGEVVDLERDRAMLAAEHTDNPQPITTTDNLVYVIYTSGSTGVPKGVAVRHRNLVNYTQAILQLLEVDRPLAFATVSTISADLGNTCIFPALVSGGCLHILSYEVAMEGDQLRDYFARRPIDVLKIVPSHLYGLLATQTNGGILPAKYLILGGEALSWDLVRQISRLDHSCRIINHYGPTETTVGSLTFAVDEENDAVYSATVPIGRPLANTRCYILDRWQRPVVPGVVGELYIGGAGVAAGYLNQPAETATRFVQDPLAHGARMYRTGDLARYLVAGNIEFLGRADHQVKVRGHRVELGEIEAVLAAHPGVRQAIVTARRGESEDVRILAYLVGASMPHDELRAALRKKLPEYMLPSAFVFLKALPLTPNGKIDRAALPGPEDVRAGVQAEFVAPRTPVEEKLAGLWAGLLKVKTLGVYDNFFELGGHSLLATQVVSRMRKEFQVEITLVSLFESPTVAAMAEKIEKATADNTARLLMELDQLSDDEAGRLLGLEQS